MKNKLALYKKINEWIEIAEEDYNVAKLGLSISSSVSYRIIVYHSQQCVEKYLKAFLVSHQIDFPYTHNITMLLDLCSEIHISFEELRKAEILTGYAIANRYPGEYRKIKKADAIKAVRLAGSVRLFIANMLRTENIKINLPDIKNHT